MPSDVLDNTHGHPPVRWDWPTIHPEGRVFGGISAALAALMLLIGWPLLGWPLVGLTVFIVAFFRDPARVSPQGEALILSPADGLVTTITMLTPPAELTSEDSLGQAGLGAEPVARISIFMSVFDVHINRAPINGTVRRVIYIPGSFVSADLDKASAENERQHILIARGDGLMIGFTQIAGLLARRIVPFVKPGDIIAAGQRVGLIRFGSRVDVYLPAGTAPLVLPGQRVVGGETVLAELGRTAVLAGVRQ